MIDDNNFGDWLKLRRRDLDLTQKQLGHQLGCSTAMIRKIEANKRRPSKELAALLASRMGLHAEQESNFIPLRPFRSEL